MFGDQDHQDVNYSLRSAVCEGRLERARELINSYGPSYCQEWSEGYEILCDAFRYEQPAIAKLLLTSGCRVNSKINEMPSNTPLHFAVINGDIEIVKMILDKGADIDAKSFYGESPLHFAVIKDKIEIFKMLLTKGANIDAKTVYGRTPLLKAIQYNNMEATELLLKHKADILAEDNDGTTPLHVAAKVGWLQIVEHLLKCGANVNCVTRRRGYAPLHFAAGEGNKEVVTLLLSSGATVDVKEEDSITPLHAAAEQGYICIAKDLLNHGACIHSLTKDGYTPLHFASEVDNEEAVKLFLNRGADINASTKGNLTPLHIATKTGHETVVKLLLQHGAKVDSQDKDGKTILHLAVEKGNFTIVKDVLKYCPDIYNKSNRSSLKIAVHHSREKYENIVEALLEYGLMNPEEKNNSEFLHDAVKNGYLKIIEDLLKYGADVNMLYNLKYAEDGFTPLHSAAINKQEEVAKLLISYEADINTPDQTGKTPLFYAIKNADLNITNLLLTNGANIMDRPELLNMAAMIGCIEIVEALLQHDADINAYDKHGRTALQYTAIESEYQFEDPDNNIRGEIAKLLLSKGANVDGQSQYDEPTLHCAVKKGYAKVVEVLLEYNANVNSGVNSDITPLHLSAQSGNKEISIMLLNKGADVNAKQEDGTTALHIATQNGDEELVKVLLKCGANVDSKIKNDVTPLHISVQRGYKEISKMLLNKGSDVNAKQEDETTALHIATQNGDEELVKVLLKCGANVDSKIKNDVTPLHISAHNRNKEISKMLLNKGANVNAKQEDETTALHIATQNGDEELVKVLLKCGADINSRDKCGKTALDHAIARSLLFCSRLNRDPDDEDLISDLFDSQREVTAKTLIHHIVKMKTANLYVSEKKILSMRSSKLSDFKDKCEKEIASMKREKINNLNISFYDILAKGTSSLAIYMRNENIVHVLKSKNYKTKFPIYSSMIQINFKKGIERKELLESGFKIFHFLFNNFPELPYNCTEKIFSYMSDAELRILMNACKPLGICNTKINDAM